MAQNNKPRVSGRHKYAAICTIMLFSVILILIVGIFSWLYSDSRQSLNDMWKVNVAQMARDVEYYLTCPADAVVLASRHVEEMMRRGASNEEIREYLVNETEAYSAIVDSNTTGVYGYCRGEYLDGSGWTPEADYVPTERPWYVQARLAGGEITFVKPYLNIQTFTMMMSVSRLLYDGESVISMDIFLDSVQNMSREKQISDQVDVALILDTRGCVVAHSDAKEIGRDYRLYGNIWERELARGMLAADEAVFSVDTQAGRQRVFSKRINSEWVLAMIVSDAKMHSPIQYVYLCFGLVLVLVVLALAGIFLAVSRKYREIERLDREVQAAAEMYDAMYLINLTTDMIQPVRAEKAVERYLAGNYTHCSAKMLGVASWMATEGFKPVLESFMDLSTLEARMRDMRFVSQEYLDRLDRWMRMRFVAVSRDASDGLREILWTFESIDEDRRRREDLKRMAEMDAMTNTRNRSSGEALVRQMMADGVTGMFMLMDVDKFKSVNDQFGHAVGDQVLIGVAAAMRASMCQEDVVFRLGGDEFAAYLPGIQSEASGRQVMDALLRGVNGIRIAAMEGKMDVRVSIGVTFFFPGRGDTFETLYRRADEGMYESKQSGGNHATFVPAPAGQGE